MRPLRCRLTLIALAAVFLAEGLAAGTAVSALSDDQRAQLLEEASGGYDNGMRLLRSRPGEARAAFGASARRYQQLVDDGVINGTLQYNLGNAWLQAGELGRAILHYRWAESLIPGDPKLAHNLAYARTLCRNQIVPSGERAILTALTGWHRRTPIAWRYVAFVVTWVAGWGLLVVTLYRPSGTLRWFAAGSGAIAVLLGASLTADLIAGDRDRIGVVLVDDVTVRKGHGEGYQPQFEEPLHQGVEFEVRSQRGDWFEIELANRKTGWVRADQVGLVGGA